MSEQANQLHNPPVMLNEREITFYAFLHLCDKHAVFFCVGGNHWDFNHNRAMWLWWLDYPQWCRNNAALVTLPLPV